MIEVAEASARGGVDLTGDTALSAPGRNWPRKICQFGTHIVTRLPSPVYGARRLRPDLGVCLLPPGSGRT